MKHSIITILLILSAGLSAISIGDWQDIRYSGRSSAGDVLTRFELGLSPLSENLILHDPGTGVTSLSASLLDASTATYQTIVPSGTTRKYLGLSAISGSSIRKLVPVYYGGTGLPTQSQMTKASDDVSNDQSTNYRDILTDYLSISNNKIYGAIRNRGGGFPFTAAFGTQINSYMVAFANPADNPSDPNAIAWGMVYWNVSLGGLTPGLYKLQGTTATRIGDIEYQVVTASNLLIMSCNIADLLAQPEFASWYDPQNPVMGMQSLINRTTIVPFETVQMDKSPGVTLYPVPLYFDPSPNTQPLLSQPVYHADGGDIYFSAEYFDPEANFPREIRVRLLNDNSVIPLYSQAVNYSQPVQYRSANLTATLGERVDDQFRIEATDNGDVFSNTSWTSFERILGIRSPEEVSAVPGEESIDLSWEPVTLTELGNPVIPSYYRIEASQTPDFASPAQIGTTTSPNYSIPLTEAYGFYRVIAVRE